MLHQRRHAQRVARVVGEHQEGAAVGDEAAVQRHAVHDRASCRTRARRSRCSCRRVVAARRPASPDQSVRLEPVRSAEPPTSSGSAGASASSAFCEALRVAMRLGLRLRPPRAMRVDVRRPVGRQLAAPCGARTRRRAPGCACAYAAKRCVPLAPRSRAPARARVPAARRPRAGSRTAGACQPMCCARRGDLLGAERRAVRVVRARLVRRALADHGLAADQRRPVASRPCAASIARVDRVDVVAVDVADHVPAVGLEALRRVVGEPALRRCRRSRCRCRRRSAISLPRPSVPASEQASCEMPSIRQPSPRKT